MTLVSNLGNELAGRAGSVLNRGRKYEKPLNDRIVAVFRQNPDGSILRLEPPVPLRIFEQRFGGKNFDGTHLYATNLDTTPEDMKPIFDMMA